MTKQLELDREYVTKNGVSLSVVLELEQNHGGFVDDQRTLSTYTTDKSSVNKQFVINIIDEKLKT